MVKYKSYFIIKRNLLANQIAKTLKLSVKRDLYPVIIAVNRFMKGQYARKGESQNRGPLGKIKGGICYLNR
jgi:hypothetical protein